MKKLLIILFLILITPFFSSAEIIDLEYKKEKVELCIPWEETEKIEKSNIDCISGSKNLFSEESINIAIDFTKKIKYAYKIKNFDILANSFTYPLFIHGYKGQDFIEIKSKEEFLKLDKKIILNKNIYKEIEKNKLFWNWKGFMLGQGVIWFWADTDISDISININNKKG